MLAAEDEANKRPQTATDADLTWSFALVIVLCYREQRQLHFRLRRQRQMCIMDMFPVNPI